MYLMENMRIIEIDNGSNPSNSDNENNMDSIAEMYGAKETVRNSTSLVEAAFDGDLGRLAR